MTDLATLVVKLEAETSKYQKGLDDATSKLKKFQEDQEGILKEAATKLVEFFAIKEVVDFAAELLEANDALNKLAQITGVSTEALSQLQYAASLSGVDNFAKDLEKLARTSTEAAQGNETVANAFDEIGVSVKDATGNIKSADQLLTEIAQSVSQYQDGLAKTAVVQQIFGKGSAALIPFLDKGAAGLAELREEAQKLGVSLSGEAAKGSEEFEENLTRLKAAGTGVVQEVLAKFLPTLLDLSDILVADAKSGDGFIAIVDELVSDLKAVAAVGYTVYRTFVDLGTAIGGVTAAATAFVSGNFKEAKAIYTQVGADLASNQVKADAVLAKLREDAEETDKIAEAAGKSADEVIAQINSGGGKEIDIVDPAAKKKLDDLTKSLATQIATYDQGAAATIRYRLTVGDLSDVIAKVGKNGALTAQQIEGLTIALQAQKDNDAVAQLAIQMDNLRGNTAKAASAASDLQTRVLRANLAAEGNTKGLALVDQIKSATVAQATLNDLQQKANDINQKYADTADEVNRKISTGQEDQIQGGQELEAARKTQIDQLTQVSVAAQGLGDKFGATLPKLKDGTDKLNNSVKDLITRLQATNFQALKELDIQMQQLTGDTAAAAVAAFDLSNAQLKLNLATAGDTAGLKKLDQLRDATAAQATFNQLQQKSSDIQAALGEQIDDINRKNAAGQITDIDAQNQINAAQQTAVTQLQGIDNALTAIGQNSGIPKLQTDAAAAANATAGINAQIDPLTKALRTDLVQDSSDAFTAFETGAKSASDAAYDFLTSLEKQLLDLANKQLFQQLFAAPDSSGSGGGLLGGLAGLFSGSVSGTAHAGGGRYTAGVPISVGEHGTEGMVPDSNGTIVPTNKWNQGSQPNISFYISAPDGKISRATQTQIAASTMRGLQAANARNN